MKIKIFLALIAPLALTGCFSASLHSRVDALEAVVEQNHQDMHTEDAKLAESIGILSKSLRSNGLRTADCERKFDSLHSSVVDLEDFKVKHDIRWPPPIKLKKAVK